MEETVAFNSGRYIRKITLAMFGLTATAYGTIAAAGAQQLPPASLSASNISSANFSTADFSAAQVPMHAGPQFEGTTPGGTVFDFA